MTPYKVLYMTTMANPKANGRRWGAAVIVKDGQNGAWVISASGGAHVSKLRGHSYALQTRDAAKQRCCNLVNSKECKGYQYTHGADQPMSDSLNNIALALTSNAGEPQIKAPTPQDLTCKFCKIWNAVTTPKTFLTALCSICSKPVAFHASAHPHNLGTCNQFSLTPPAWAAYMKEIDQAPQPTPEQSCDFCVADRKTAIDRQPARAEAAPALKLLDLQCDCTHWLNVHDPEDVHACYVSICKCEAYRRTCQECQEVTRRSWRHAASCFTGMREKLTAEPVNQAEVVPAAREQRSISKRLLDAGF